MTSAAESLNASSMWAGAAEFELPLVGAGGEPVDLWRTLISHGLTSLPPMSIDADQRRMLVTLPLAGNRPRLVQIASAGRGRAVVRVAGRRPGARQMEQIAHSVGHMLRLEEDLSDFYARLGDDPDLRWVTHGAGRMLRSPTVFEEVIKTICTTNCAWSGTQRMIAALCQHLGQPGEGAPEDSPLGRAFPTPEAMADAGESFYRDVARAGYRGAYMTAIARGVADGELDLEALGRTDHRDLSDAVVAERLLELPGVGPYAAAHIMLILGRYSRLILDSWTRPTYLRLTGMKRAKDSTIERRFKSYGRYRGLAFWLFLTRDWEAD